MEYFGIDFERVNNDVNGNPRYVCHFLSLISERDRDKDEAKGFKGVDYLYNLALDKAKTIGGKKFHNKQYGGGIVFSSYNLRYEAEQIALMNGTAIVCHRPPTKYEIEKGYGDTHYRTFLKSEITKKNGEIKKFFKCKDDGLYYSTR